MDKKEKKIIDEIFNKSVERVEKVIKPFIKELDDEQINIVANMIVVKVLRTVSEVQEGD